MEISKKELKSIFSQQRKEYQRYLGIAVENFTDQVKTVAEILSDLQQQLSVLRELVAINTEDIQVMKTDIHFIKNSLTSLTPSGSIWALRVKYPNENLAPR